MKKLSKIFAAVLCLALVLSVLPTAFAVAAPATSGEVVDAVFAMKSGESIKYDTFGRNVWH